MRYLRFLLLSLVVMAALGVVVALSLPSPKGASGTTAGYPDSMASLGDSFTRAMNPGPSLSGDQPQYSWSTGDDSAIQSHYYRILQQNSGIVGNNFNDAVSGARMVALNGQAQSAVSQGVEYVTILMGANDVCRSSEATMTAVETFRSQFQQAMDTLTTGLPDARIFVASIPDIYVLWFILKDNPSAVSVWSILGICQSLLANPTSTAQADVDRRGRVRQRNIDFNSVLAEECAQYIQCRFDNNAGFNTQFEPIHVSTLDYFHPSLVGQTLVASVTWAATYDFSAATPNPTATPTPAPTSTPTLVPTPTPGVVGGIADFPDVKESLPGKAEFPAGSSRIPHAALAGSVAAAAVAIVVAGGWYARRRWRW